MVKAARKKAPRWQRRKADRPDEIVVAAGRLFAERGFAKTKLDDVADLAGVAKGSIYLYFETKEQLFRAVVRAAVVPQIAVVRGMADAFEGPLSQFLPKLLNGAAAAIGRPPLGAVVRMVIGESRNFPDLAQIWHDEVVSPVLGVLASAIARGQAQGDVAKGDPRLYAFSVMGPLIMAMLFREVFSRASDDLPDLGCLADQHARCLLNGLAI